MTRAKSAAKLAVALWMIAVTAAMFLWVPAQQGLGNTGRIIIMHIPTAWLSTLAFFVSAIWSGLYLWKRRPADDDRALAAVEQGFLFTILATASGAIFAKAVWGAFWNWDARQTTILILLLIYGAYFALRSAIEDVERRRQLAAVYALFAFATSPFLTYVLPRLATSTLHPNCAFIDQTANCEGITLAPGRVGALNDTVIALQSVEQRGELLVATVEVRGVGGAAPTLLRPSYNTVSKTGVDKIDFPGTGLTLVIERVNADGSLFFNQEAQSQLSNTATLTTFLAAVVGFTGLFWWIWGLRVRILGLQRSAGHEALA